jgi:hypothetical protein
MYKYFPLPNDWSAEQAWAVLEFIYQLEELVWNMYDKQLLEIVGPKGPDPPTNPNEDLSPDENLDDDIPF